MGDEDRLSNAIGEIERLRAEMRLDLAIQEMVQLAKLLRRELNDVRAERDYWREATATTPIPMLVHSAGTKRCSASTCRREIPVFRIGLQGFTALRDAARSGQPCQTEYLLSGGRHMCTGRCSSLAQRKFD
jgi:hypothetical protein